MFSFCSTNCLVYKTISLRLSVTAEVGEQESESKQTKCWRVDIIRAFASIVSLNDNMELNTLNICILCFVDREWWGKTALLYSSFNYCAQWVIEGGLTLVELIALQLLGIVRVRTGRANFWIFWTIITIELSMPENLMPHIFEVIQRTKKTKIIFTFTDPSSHHNAILFVINNNSMAHGGLCTVVFCLVLKGKWHIEITS